MIKSNLENIFLKLRYYQKDAVEKMINYINSDEKSTALVKMPTGTGKTGIIAILSQVVSKGNVIIIVPNSILPYQIKEDIDVKFWRDIGYDIKTKKKIILINTYKNIQNIESTKQIFITTIQQLDALNKKHPNEFENFKHKCKLLLFDEGHREFSDVWKMIVDNFKCKKILFTATPYRNDKNAFDISSNNDYKYKYSLNQALKDKSICNVKFNEIDVLNKQKLLEFIIAKVDDNSKNKILIRINNPQEIKILVKDINNIKPDIACGFHSKFDKADHLYSKGKDINNCKENYKVFIHSDMLIEGLNVKELNILIFRDMFSNMKTNVQQIGRILRLSDNKSISEVYGQPSEIKWLKEQWKLYKKEDDQKDGVEIKYVRGEFKEKFKPTKQYDFYKHILIPKSAQIFIDEDDIIEEIVNKIRQKINKRIDCKIYNEGKYNEKDVYLWIICYEKISFSRYLEKDYYQNNSLEIVSLAKIKGKYNDNDKYVNYIFYLDSLNSALPEFTKLKYLDSISVGKLLPSDSITNSKFTLATQRKTGVQTREYFGIAINSSKPDISQKLSFCKYISGYLEDEKSKRNLNPMKSKVSEYKLVNYKGYIEWCKSLIEEINQKNYNKYLKRFATPTYKPDTEPTSILIELGIKMYWDINTDEENIQDKEFDQESIYSKINNNEFIVNINNIQYKGYIQNKNNKIKIKIEGTKDLYVDEYKVESFIKYINNGNFQLYYGKENIVYYNNYFLKPNITTKFNSPNDWDLWSNIKVIKDLKDCKSEKEYKKCDMNNSMKTWAKESVFRSILDEIDRNYKQIDYIVCEDLGCEMCDFIALSTETNTCYFIHCKHKKGDISASAFQDICGQAVKNIHYIIQSNFNELEYVEKHIKHWQNDWECDGVSIPRLQKCPIGKDVDDFVDAYKSILSNESGKKKVWLVNSGLSYRKFEEQLTKNKQAEQVPQLIWLLENTKNTMSDVGAGLEIFCSE